MRKGRLTFAATAFCVSVLHASAQEDQPPPYDKGPVWDIQQIRTKDGHFGDYMKWIDTEWKPEMEALKSAGRLLGYKVYVVDSPRKGEGDVWLAAEFPNMAAGDHSTAEDYALEKKVVGSIAKANQGMASRESIREVVSEITVREMTLK